MFQQRNTCLYLSEPAIGGQIYNFLLLAHKSKGIYLLVLKFVGVIVANIFGFHEKVNAAHLGPI